MPSVSQREWQDLEVGAMFTWNVQTLCNASKVGPYGPRTVRCQKAGWLPTDAEVHAWNPSAVDTDEWIRVAKSFGARYAVLVADHFSGFTLWPTRTYPDNYSIGGTRYKGGGAAANIVAEFVASCVKYDVQPGVFYSVHMNWHEGVDNFKTRDPSKQAAYNQLSVAQLTELLQTAEEARVRAVAAKAAAKVAATGKAAAETGADAAPTAMTELWFDAGVKLDVNPLVGPAVATLAPTAVCHSCAGFDTRADGQHYGLRWMGNEEGVMPLPSWGATAANCAGPYNGVPNATGGDYCPPSVDTVLSEHYWFWYPGTEAHIKSTRTLVSNYLTSVGRAANLILNVAPDPTGAIPAADVAAYGAMGAAIRCLFGPGTNVSHTVAPAPSASDPHVTQWSVGPQPAGLQGFRNVSVHVGEELSQGQLMRGWRLEALARPSASPGASWAWVSLANGTGVGHKRMLNVVPALSTGGSPRSTGRPGAGTDWAAAWSPLVSTTVVGAGEASAAQLAGVTGVAADISALRLTVLSSFAVAGQAPRVAASTLFNWTATEGCVP